MALSTVEEVRLFGNLPVTSKLTDDQIGLHLAGAARKLKSWIGEYQSTSDTEKQEACKEAECCLCMANLQPILHTFYTEGLTTLQSELGGMEITHLSPDNWKSVAGEWTDRARDMMQDYIDTKEASTRVGWYAI